MKNWEMWKKRLSDSHECSFAEKKKRKERAGGGFLIEKKREWEMQGCELINRERGGMVTELKLEGEI